MSFTDPHVFASMMALGASLNAPRYRHRGQFDSIGELKAHFAVKKQKKKKRKMVEASKKRNRGK